LPVAVEVRDLVKEFKGGVLAVDGVSFEVEAGTVFGLLGPNGAGKTTIVRILATVLSPTSGVAQVLGHDVVSESQVVRSLIGLAGQFAAVDENLTGKENLQMIGRLNHLAWPVVTERTNDLLERFDLVAAANRPVKTYSGGMRRRLDVGAALVARPRVLFLDEPTTGLDPQARHLLWDRLYRLKQQGVTQIITTHYMDEAEQLCDRLAVMDHGSFAAEGTPRDLIDRYATREVLELRFGTDEQEAAAKQMEGLAERIEILPDRLLLYMFDGDEALRHVHERGLVPVSALVRRSTLEDVFLRLTGRTLVD
jgi:lipooligosaccharide transport system ATP-binding protein